MKIIKYIFEAVFIYSIFLIIKIVGINFGRKISSLLMLSLGSFFRSKKVINENINNALGNITEVEKKILLIQCGKIMDIPSQNIYL